MSTEVSVTKVLVHKKEETCVEFKEDSALNNFLFLKTGEKKTTYSFKQVSLIINSSE